MNRCFLAVAVASVMGCGVASVSPIITDSNSINDPALLGTWRGAKESAVITARGANGYHVLYTEDGGKTGEFHGRMGRLGSSRVLDLQPVDPMPAASDTYKSLLLRAHGMVIIDSVGKVIQFRILEPDSLKAYLKKHPRAVSHTMVENAVLLTGSTVEIGRFLATYMQRSAVLDERNVWRREVR